MNRTRFAEKGKKLLDLFGHWIGLLKDQFSHWLELSSPDQPAFLANPILGTTSFGKINYFFVLMLENRSFDHMLGYCGIPQVDGLTGREFNLYDLDQPEGRKAMATPDSPLVTEPDPPHEFKDVSLQLLGNRLGTYNDDSKILNQGFVQSYAESKLHQPIDPGSIMKAFNPKTLPILNTLAREYAICDRWFSSMPGPTWPNRFFLHAATSGGLDDSPTLLATVKSYIQLKGFNFENGSIFSRLSEKGIHWRVYHGDALPQVASISGMMKNLIEGDSFREFDSFSSEIKNIHHEFNASYVFIEPNYGNAYDSDSEHDFEGGNSQHPVDDVTQGERLIKELYETIRSSTIWEQSCLIITYDEHGGFYDHVKPEATVSPEITNKYSIQNFDFKRLGVRVPALVISPYIQKGTIDHKTHDHSSIPATLEKRFNLPPMTQRDRSSETLEHLFNLKTPRKDAPLTLPQPYETEDFLKKPKLLVEPTDLGPIDHHTGSFLHLAFRADATMDPENIVQITNRLKGIWTKKEAKRYIGEVQKKLKKRKKSKIGLKQQFSQTQNFTIPKKTKNEP